MYKYVVVFSNRHLTQKRKVITAFNQKQAEEIALKMKFPRGYYLDFVVKLRSSI